MTLIINTHSYLKNLLIVPSSFFNLFYGISDIIGYLMPWPSLQKGDSEIIYSIAKKITGFMPFRGQSI